MFVAVFVQLEIRKAAFATLRSVAGIVRKSQLHQLLLDLGLLQHVEVDEVRMA